MAVVFCLILVKPWKLQWRPVRARDAQVAPGAVLSSRGPQLPLSPRPRPEERPDDQSTDTLDGSGRGATDNESTARAGVSQNQNDGIFLVTDPRTLLVGYGDSQGHEVIPPRFEWGGPFINGRAKVELGGQFGFVDRDGHLVVPTQFDSIFDYVHGVAVAMKDGWYFFIDEAGRPISNERFDYAWPHSADGLALVKRDGLFGYVDGRGQLVVPTVLEETFGFTEGLAVAKVRGLYGFLDRAGRFVVEPQYDYAWPVASGSATVRKNREIISIDLSAYTDH